MQFLEDLLIEPLRVMKAFLLGRGLLTLGVIGTWAIANAIGVGVLVPAAIAAIGGLAFSGFMRITNQAVYEDQMVNMYRDGIAQQLGIDPKDVTRANLRDAAKHNDVIDQALQRQSHKSWISFGTSALAAAATVGLIALGAPQAIAGLFGSGTAGTALGYASFGIVSTISSLIVHDGLQTFIGHKTGVSKAAAHDRIFEMERGLARGWGVSKEQVYGALVAGNTSLQATIAQEFGKPFASMRPSEQGDVLDKIGVADEMLAIAAEINAGRMRPSNLAFMMNEAMPRPNKPLVVNDNDTPRRNHVAALGRGARDGSIGHVARLDADRAMAALNERGA